MDGQKCRAYWDRRGRPCAICQAACPWNFENTWFHNLLRNLNQQTRLFRKPAMWGYKLFYERKEWDHDPVWAFDPKD
jgi:hypothetical protein